MTEKQKEALKYKNEPEGSLDKKNYDRYFLPFSEYLTKYYSNSNFEQWDRWQMRYIEPSFDESKHDEFVKNWGYLKKEYHNFDEQYNVYNQLKDDNRLPEDVKKFIGFLIGANQASFLKKYYLTLEQWFNIKNWQNPYLEETEDGHTINEILSYPYGINYFKTLLTQMPFWNR